MDMPLKPNVLEDLARDVGLYLSIRLTLALDSSSRPEGQVLLGARRGTSGG